jgi:hypothetical protein
MRSKGKEEIKGLNINLKTLKNVEHSNLKNIK